MEICSRNSLDIKQGLGFVKKICKRADTTLKEYVREVKGAKRLGLPVISYKKWKTK